MEYQPFGLCKWQCKPILKEFQIEIMTLRIGAMYFSRFVDLRIPRE